MATLTKQFSFNIDNEGWTSSGSSTFTRDTTEDSTNDTNSGTGVLQTYENGSNVTYSGYWTWSGTFENLGVPSGAIITGINVAYDYKCYLYTKGRTSYSGLMGRYNSGALVYTYSSAQAFSNATSWIQVGGTPESGLAFSSNITTEFRLNMTLSTGPGASSVVGLRQDWIQVVITYTPFVPKVIVM